MQTKLVASVNDSDHLKGLAPLDPSIDGTIAPDPASDIHENEICRKIRVSRGGDDLSVASLGR